MSTASPECKACERLIQSPGVVCRSCGAAYHQDCYPGRCQGCRSDHAVALGTPAPETLDDLSTRELAGLMASELEIPFYSLSGFELSAELASLLPREILLEKLFIPVHLEEGVLTLVVADPLDDELAPEIARRTGYRIQTAVGDLVEIRDVLERTRFP